MELDELRRQIDETDGQLTALLVRRMDISREISRLKDKGGMPTLDEKRQETVRERVKQRTPAPLHKYILAIYEEIMGQSRLYQNELRGE